MNRPIPLVVSQTGDTSEAVPGSIPIALFKAQPSYGSFYDIITQPLTANANHTVLLRDAYLTENTSVVGNTRITFAQAGVYDIQFSLQIASTTNQTRNLWIWGAQNGADLEHSAGRISITEQNNVIVPTWNYHLLVEAGDYFELKCRSSGDQVSIAAEPNGGPYPAVPSAILTVQQIDL